MPARSRDVKLITLKEGKRVVAAELLHHGLAKVPGEHVLEFGHFAGIGEESGHRGTVPVAAERDDIFATQVKPVFDMGCQLVEGDVCGGLVGCVVG